MSLIYQLMLRIRRRKRAGKEGVANGSCAGRLDTLSFEVVPVGPGDKQLSIISNMIMDFGI